MAKSGKLTLSKIGSSVKMACLMRDQFQASLLVLRDALMIMEGANDQRHLVVMAKRNGHPKMFGFLVTAAMRETGEIHSQRPNLGREASTDTRIPK